MPGLDSAQPHPLIETLLELANRNSDRFGAGFISQQLIEGFGARLAVTSPVGLFPRSRSRDFALEDMAGNVWEWCDSPWSPGDKSRVLRGGSFDLNAPHVRSDIRRGNDPDYRANNTGFRVARTNG